MPPSRILIEAACETVDDAVEATAGGADRIELCAALDLGGLTPSVGLMKEVRAATHLPICVMIRPRAGDFVYSDADFRVMARDLEEFKPFAPAAFVFGILTADAEIDEVRCAKLVQRAAPTPCVFHRAFDRAHNLVTGLETLVKIGFKRVLTSGRAPTAAIGIENLLELNTLAAGRIEILPGGSVRAENAAEIVKGTGCRQLHASFSEEVPESDEKARKGYPPRNRLSREQVAATRAVVDPLV